MRASHPAKIISLHTPDKIITACSNLKAPKPRPTQQHYHQTTIPQHTSEAAKTNTISILKHSKTSISPAANYTTNKQATPPNSKTPSTNFQTYPPSKNKHIKSREHPPTAAPIVAEWSDPADHTPRIPGSIPVHVNILLIPKISNNRLHSLIKTSEPNSTFQDHFSSHPHPNHITCIIFLGESQHL